MNLGVNLVNLNVVILNDVEYFLMSDSESDDSKPANSRPSKVFVTGMDGAVSYSLFSATSKSLSPSSETYSASMASLRLSSPNVASTKPTVSLSSTSKRAWTQPWQLRSKDQLMQREPSEHWGEKGIGGAAGRLAEEERR